ncbi:hypothetical protein M9H77_07957 [Catharanthus roseus]|uniref:Uncharacterized protein n=1 Tax=Catharanthus roseus TaxID=4058 RepID=A0ACC0BWN7_CATRO|nr:hypothetical protein M9H77_07957 [Catharanthus roseus]
MEEVLAHVHPGPIVHDVLTRQHEHRSGLIWSVDHETCFTDLQCRRFSRNLFQCYSTAPRRLLRTWFFYIAVVHGSFRGCTTNRGSLNHSTGLGVVVYPCIAASTDDGCSGRPFCSTWCYMLRGNDHTYWGTQHASHVEVWHQWRLHVTNGPALAVEVLSYPNDEYIRWYRRITRVYIGNPANRYTRSTLLRRCMVSIAGTLGCTPSQYDIQQTFPIPSRHRPREPVPDRDTRGIKRGTRRLPGRGARGGRPPVPPFPGRHGHADPRHVEVGEVRDLKVDALLLTHLTAQT